MSGGPPPQPRALLTVLRGSAVPYGYTLTVLASHSILANAQGGPDVVEILVFVIGAILAFASLAILAERRGLGRARADAGGGDASPGRADMIHAGMIHVFAIGAAFGAVTAIALIPGLIAWGLGAFAATALYLTITSLEIDLAERIDE